MTMLEARRLRRNTIASVVLQVATIVCRFFLPRLILKAYGSEVNGLVNSINQFLSMISFLELGVGAVVQSALYKPLAVNDFLQVNRIISSAEKFFRKLANFLIVYITFLVILYPLLVNQSFEVVYSASLIIIIGISSFAQYYFGLVDGIFLLADQRGYIYYSVQIVTLILNTLFCVFMINIGSSIHAVKLMTSCVFILRPIIIRNYVNKRYHINRKEKYDVEPIDQKWNGVAQHVAAIIFDSTDTVILTIFSNVSYVSVYSVYNMVVMGIRQLIIAACSSVSSFWGRLLARNEISTLKESFAWTEWLTHTVTVLLFGCTLILIDPFIMIYTDGVNDIEYFQPVFSAFLTLSGALRCIRLPYNSMIISGGHYRQTENNYIVAAILNIVISIILVVKFGLVGVAVGTLIAMTYQTVWMAVYISKNLIFWPIRNFVKQLFVDIISIIVCVIVTNNLSLETVSYVSWIKLALCVFVIWVIAVFIINLLFYQKWIKKFIEKLSGSF